MGIAASTPTYAALDEQPNNTFLGEPDSKNHLVYTSTLATFEYQLGNRWLFKAVGDGTGYDRQPRDIVLGALAADRRTINRSADYRLQTLHYGFGEGTLVGSITTGGLEHRIAAGASYQSTGLDEERHTGAVAPIDIFEPVYSGLPADAQVQITGNARQDVDIAAVFAQDQVAMGSRVRVQLGARWTSFDQTNLNRLNGTTQVINASKVTPQAGVVFLPIPSLSVYGSYSRSFAPTVFIPGDGRIFDPSTGEQYEVGTKAEVLDRRLSVTAAVFRLTRENVLSFFRDPVTGIFTSDVGGVHRSSGFELDAAGQLARSWTLIASYGHINGRVISDPAYAPGTLIGGAPRHKASAWSTYQFGNGLAIGGGVFYQSEFKEFTSSVRALPGRTTADLTASYRISRQLHARVNVKNVTDERYYLSGAGTSVGYPAPPRTVQGQLLVTF
jgi:iron complex outermembrane receptor protein